MQCRALSSVFAAAASVALAGCIASPPGVAPLDPFNWSITLQVESPSGAVLAVLETGKSNTGARTSPLHRVSIRTVDTAKEFHNHSVVWQSQVQELPTLTWTGPRSLVITQDPHLVLEYEPEVMVGDQAYAVDVSVRRTGP